MQKRTFNHCPEHRYLCYFFPVPVFAPSVGLCLLSKLSLAYLHMSSFRFYSPFLPVHIFAPKRLCPCPCPVNISKTHMKVRTHNRNTSSIGIGYMYVTALKMQHAWTGWMFRGFQGANGFRHVTFQDIITTREQEVFLPTNKNMNS